MAFESTNVPPSTGSKVTLTFSGQMVLKPGAVDRTCEIGVNKAAPEHQFQVLLILSRPGKLPVVGSVFTGPMEKALTISRTRIPEPEPDFRVYEEDKFDRSVIVGDDTPPPLDHRWAINIALKHPGADINNQAKPVITLKTGVLYTPYLTDSTFNPTFKNGNQEEKLNQIAPSLAVSIEPEGSITLQGEDRDRPLILTLPRPGDPDKTTYTLAFVNDPSSFAVPSHNEFELYYNILQLGGRPITNRFTLEFDPPHGRLDEVPCMITTKNP